MRYYYGKRWTPIHHARMRIGCSKLNADLTFNLHVLDNASCDCGYPIEDAQHYLMDCNQFNEERRELFDKIVDISEPNVNLLLFGDFNLTAGQNELIFDAVHGYMTTTDRFK